MDTRKKNISPNPLTIIKFADLKKLQKQEMLPFSFWHFFDKGGKLCLVKGSLCSNELNITLFFFL